MTTTNPTKKAPTNNVPQLRFPEFEGEWNEKKLMKLASNHYQGINTAADRIEYFSYGYPIIQAKHITSGRISFGSARYLSNKDFFKYKDKYSPQKNDLLLSNIGTIGKISVVEDEQEFLIAWNIFLLRLDVEKSNYKFVYFQLKKRSEGGYFEKLQTGNATKFINKSDILKIPIALPTLPEQQKIAGFLTAVDARIDQLRRKKELLTQYKKGLMQQLLTQQLRFTDHHGHPYPDWQETQFKELYDFVPTNSLSRDNLNYTEGNVFNIHYGDIHTKFKPSFHLNKEDVPLINANVDIKKYSKSYCTEGDLIIADASEDYDDIGKALEIIGINGSNILAGLHTIHARRISNKIIVGYGAYLMASSSVKKDIKFIAQGAKVLGISSKNIAKLKFLLPHPNEQQKIAACLSAVDDHITHVSQQLTHTQTFKQGLLQQLFV